MITRSKEGVSGRGKIVSTNRAWRTPRMSLSQREKGLNPVILDGQMRVPWKPTRWGTFTELNLVFQEKQESTAGGEIIDG